MYSTRTIFLVGLAVCAANLISGGHLGPQPVQADTLFQDNFNSGNANRWSPLGGTWAVVNGKYVGEGTSLGPSPCGQDPAVAETLIRNLQAENVDIEADIKSIERVDKSIAFRWADNDRQVMLGIRAERPGAFPADLLVVERKDCQHIVYTSEFSVLIPPHQVGQTIHVHAILIGKRLRVLIDKVLVLDRIFPFSLRSGKVALEVNEGGITTFDNVKVRFGIIDQDGDGVRDGLDMCPGTVLPEKVPTVRLGDDRFANIDKDLAFETKPPLAGPGEPGLTMLDTAGCSCEQIIARGHLGLGQSKFGCSRGAIKAFIAALPPG